MSSLHKVSPRWHGLLQRWASQKHHCLLFWRGLLSIFPAPLHEVLVLPCPHSAATAQNVCLQTMRQCLTAHELDILIAGELCIDIDDWRLVLPLYPASWAACLSMRPLFDST